MARLNCKKKDFADERERLQYETQQRLRRLLVRSIRNNLAWRLALSVFFFAVVISGFILYLKRDELEDQIRQLIRIQAQAYVDETVDYTRPDQTIDVRLLKAEMNAFLHSSPSLKEGRIAYLALHDHQKQRIAEVYAEPYTGLAQHLQRLKITGSPSSEKRESAFLTLFKIEGQYYVRIFGSPERRSPKNVAYVQVVFHLSPEIVAQIRARSWRSAFLVVIIVAGTALIMYPVLMALAGRIIALAVNLQQSHFEVVRVLSGAIAQRDTDTSEHNFRVAVMAVRLAEAVGIEPERIPGLFIGALMHDVGKIGVRDAILLKKGELTADERLEMEKHVHYGTAIIEGSAWLKEGTDVVRYHHERFDGNGYMEGKAAHEIPVEARIFAIVDVFDALTSKRPYKERYSYAKATRILVEGKGDHFDPEILSAFEMIARELYDGLTDSDRPQIEKNVLMIVEKYFSRGDFGILI